jgi:hypothetical protein
VRARTPRLHAARGTPEAPPPLEVGSLRLADHRKRVGLARQEFQRKNPSARLAVAAACQWHRDGFRTIQEDRETTDARSRELQLREPAVDAPNVSQQLGDPSAVIVVDVREELVKLDHQHIRHVRDGFLE